MRAATLVFAAIAPLLLGGCLASAAVDLATAPVRVAGKAVDLATTSQSEADEARGREIRRREERLGRLQRQYQDLAEDCSDGEDNACREALAVRREMDALMPGIPVEQAE
ncbi:hypothetical protein GCM10009127_01290 [Alteraurantiacibacter aestuarii]|uniref:UrcA family protein n=1 Tax=Alteraurantiacibacter aestuarii TaxID=650004 RepID=A0A844ZLC6_9SPHN|nr:hypothetical protein [Alteraurantiacibacter aestuarii]MXO88615.1 hypothetical protein [Alteraurantiacibacter aestuarii]